ncbi:MAG: nucleoporin subcomplex protein binding to Pom34-domain-containing protein [Benniella sp.]|nr:MAG: nucleoporin subcomplex protein binding to Pom34-domain-containing protein [Benniella sp.]
MSQYKELSKAVNASSFTGIFQAVVQQHGTSGRLSDTLRVLVEGKVREIQLGLEAFKAPSAASRSGMTAAMGSDGKKYTEAQVNLAKRLSDAVKLDELQALKVVEELSTEIDISDFITEEMVWKSVDTYWRERSSLVALLGELVSYAYENENNPDYESIAAVETIRSQSVNCIKRLIAQFGVKAEEEAPEYFTSNTEYLESWIGQTLTEQSALLETMLKLTYSGNDSKTELPGSVITTLIKTQFGKRQHYKAIQKLEAMDYMEDIRLMCVVLSIACLDLDTLFSASIDEAYDSCEHVFKSATQVQTVNTALQGAERQEELGPFILAWSSVLSARIEAGGNDQAELRRLAGQFAFVAMEMLEVYRFLHDNLSKDIFGKYSKYGAAYKRMFFQMVEVSLLDQEPKAIKDFENLTACLADLLTDDAELCELIWQESPKLGQGTLEVLETARGRFPLQFQPLVGLLGALATGGQSSAMHAIFYFGSLPTLAHLIPLSSQCIEIDVQPDTGATVIRSLQGVPLGIHPDRPFYLLPGGMDGSLISGENAAHIVQWKYKNSGWDLCIVMLDTFRQVNVDDLSTQSPVDIEHVKAILDLFQSAFRFPDGARELVGIFAGGNREYSLIATLFAVLEQCSKFQQPPLGVIASCLNCFTCLCDSYVQDVWLYLRQASFLPSVVTSTVEFVGSGRVQTSGLAHTILSRIECIQGNYVVTLALLGLVQKLTINAQNMELWDSKELRCLKAEVLFPCLAYLQNDIFANYENWKYKDINDRFLIPAKILSIFNQTLEDLPLLNGTHLSEYISLRTLQEYLTRNFLYDGGKQLVLPLISVIGFGPDLSAYFSRYSGLRERTEIWDMVLQGLKLVKNLLRHRKIAGGEPSFLEVYMIDRTVGRENASLVSVLASYCDFSCSAEAALVSTDVLTLLCSLSHEWSTKPSFVGYLGTTDQAQRLVSTIVSRVGDDNQSCDYRIALWSLITITLTTQPGVATLFLSNDRVDPATGLFKDHSKDISKNSVLNKALDILHRSEEILQNESEILPHALHFLDVLWQNANDHAVLVKNLLDNEAFWKDLGRLLSKPEHHTELEMGPWEEVHLRYNRDPLVQVCKVSAANADQRARGHALRIFALAIHFHLATSGSRTRDLEALPKGIKEFVQNCIRQGQFIAWNETIPIIHYHVEGHRDLIAYKEHMTSPFDYLQLAVRRWDEAYDTDHLPGDSFMLDLQKAGRKLAWGGQKIEHSFIRTILHVNLNWSIVHSELQQLSAWRFFMEVLTSDLGTSIWTSNTPTGRGSGTYYDFVNCLLGHIERDTEGSLVLREARQTCCLLLQTVIENASVMKRSDKKNLAAHFPKVAIKLQRLIHSPDLGMQEAFQNPVKGRVAHLSLMLTMLLCYRALHDKEVLVSVDPTDLEALQKSAILLLPLLANCFITVTESYLLGQHDHSDNIVVLLALLEELCHPTWNPHPALWIPILRNVDVFRFNLHLCGRSISSGEYDNRPSFFEGSLNYMLALANIPEMAAYLCDAGVMSMLTHNGLTPLLQRGEISHLDEVHGDRGNWHHAWCMMLATVTSLLRSMSTSDAFIQLLIGFIQLYGNQISKGLDTSTDRPLTSAKLEEMERITMLFYELSKHDARIESLGGTGIIKAYFDRALFILQHAVHLFTHPHALASVILPITREEHKDKEAGQGSALSTLIEGKMAAVVRNILSAMLVWTEPAVILTKSYIEWPIRKLMFPPTMNTPVYDPASIGTMFDLVQYASTSLKEWEARLEGKAGGSAGLYKDAAEDDRQKNASSSSSASGASSSKLSSRLAYFGDFFSTTTTTTSTTAAAAAAAGAGTSSSSASTSSSASSTPSSMLSSSSSASSSSSTGASKPNESAFATLSTTTGTSVRMILILEDALVVIATQLGLHMYDPRRDAAFRRDIQDQCVDLISTLNSTQRMLQRFENVPVQVRKNGLGAEAYAQIQSLRDIMIPIIKNFAETKMNVQ